MKYIGVFFLFAVWIGSATATPQFRPINGHGANKKHPLWGTPGDWVVRKSPCGPPYVKGDHSYPHPREVSNRIFGRLPSHENPLDPLGRNALMNAFSQLVDHTIILTRGSKEACPMTIGAEDPTMDLRGKNIPFARAFREVRDGCEWHKNDITSYIDMSCVYGSSDELAMKLREKKGGRMLVRRRNDGSEWLPLLGIDMANDAQKVPASEMRSAGDVRANENSVLYALQTLFVREHNRKCKELAKKYPKAGNDDEWLYQYSRRWVIAVMQHIVYDEWLPALLGAPLHPVYGYDDEVNTQCSEAFVRAAFRYGHSAVPTAVGRVWWDGVWFKHIVFLLRDAFFVPAETEKSGLAAVLLGAAKQHTSAVDSLMVDDIRNKLFGVAIDLAAINVERGRDTRTPLLNDLREALGMSRYHSMEHITCGDHDLAEILSGLYDSPDKVELFVGGLCECGKNNKSALGETFHEVISEQFRRFRKGDRFWYEWTMEAWEVAEVQRETLMTIIGKNTDEKWGAIVRKWPTGKSSSFFVPETEKCKSFYNTGSSTHCKDQYRQNSNFITICVVFFSILIFAYIIGGLAWIANKMY